MGGHKPSLVLADALNRRGIAVLRFDKRGVGQSTGDLASATLLDLAGDAAAAVAWLQAQPEIGAITPDEVRQYHIGAGRGVIQKRPSRCA